MKAPEHLTQSTAERYWITEGPNSGGIAGYLLYEGHVFPFRHEWGPIDVYAGVAIAEWIERYGAEHPDIASELLKPDG